MKNINITKEELVYFMNHCAFNYGSEAMILKANDYTLYKIFYTTGSFPIMLSDNKFNKIKYLHWHNIKHLVRPIATVSLNGNLIGYAFHYDKDLTPLSCCCLNELEKIESLKRVDNVLDYFASKDVIFGDVKSDNVLINDNSGEITFCDVDNIAIKSYPFDIKMKILDYFLTCYGKLDKNADKYMENLMTLQMLYYNETYKNILKEIFEEQDLLPFNDSINDILRQLIRPIDFEGKAIIKYVLTP